MLSTAIRLHEPNGMMEFWLWNVVMAYSQNNVGSTFFIIFVRPYSMFNVGRSMSDVHLSSSANTITTWSLSGYSRF
jgi:hypothetical protein